MWQRLWVANQHQSALMLLRDQWETFHEFTRDQFSTMFATLSIGSDYDEDEIQL